MQDHIRLTTLLLIFSFQQLLFGLLLHKDTLQATTGQQENQLRLEVETITQRFCEVGGTGRGNLQLDIHLLFTNSSKDHLILYKFGRDIVRFTISRSLEDIKAGRFEMDATQTIMTDDNPLKIDDEAFGKYFTILAPGESYKSNAKLLIPILQSTNYTKPGHLNPGRYVLQIKVSNWPEPTLSPLVFKERWRNLGKLWSDHTISLPTHFEVNDTYEGEKCDKPSEQKQK